MNLLIARRIAYNAIFNAVAKILATALALVAIGFITRYLGPEGFGNYAVALAFFSFFGTIADLGLYSVSTREISRKGADEKHIIGNIFTLRIIVSSVIFFCVPLMVWFLPYESEVKIAILISALAFFFSSSYVVLNGVFQKNLAMDRVALIELLGKILQVGIIAGVVHYDLGFIALMSSLVWYMVFNFCFVLWQSRNFVRFHLQVDVVFWKKFLKQSFPMGMATFITFLYFKFDTILLSFLQSSADVGIYNGAYKIIENITFFPAMIIGLVLPLLSRNIFENKKMFINLVNKVFKVFILLIAPLVVGVLFVAEEIVTIIGGEDFLASANVLRVLILALGLIFLSHILNAILLVANKQKALMYVLGICAIFNIGANLIFIPYFSYMGAAITSVLTEFLVLFLTFWLVQKYVRYIPKMGETVKIFLSASVMGLFLFFFSNSLPFLILISVSAAIYIGAIIATRAVSRQEIVSLLF